MLEWIGRYEIKKEIGRGGMATVYLAYDPRFKREVAIKVLPRQFTHDPRFLERFEQEALTIASLEHYAIVPVYDFGEEDDAPYLVMRYMAGGSLRERMHGEPLPLPEIIRILERLSPALDKAHQRGVIHRDLKPDNVLFDEDNQPYLADFGIARMAEATHTMTVTGTPAYMSPEQVQGEQKLDGRSDIYALGVMVYEMLTGEQAYVAETSSAQMFKHVMEPVPKALDANPELPPQTQAVIDNGMAKDRERRYQTAGELTKAIKPLLHVPTTAIKSEAAPIQDTVVEMEGIGKAQYNEPPRGSADGERESGSRGLLPAWVWWVGAAAVLLILIFGIRAAVDSGEGDPTPEAAVDGDGNIAVAASTPAPTETSIPPTPTAENTPEPTATAAPSPTAAATPTTPFDPNSPPPNAVVGSSWQRPQDDMQMLFVPSGTFSMGSEAGTGDEEPVHDVTLEGFWIDETEVTNAQYEQCVDAGACTASSYADNVSFNGRKFPVVGVSWDDANAYCTWAGGHLPSEAEWEYAARGPDGVEYPWGDVFEGTLANYCDANCTYDNHDETYDDGYERTAPVGSYPDGVSWVGAKDLAGNVWEWMNDWYDSGYYADSPGDSPEGPEDGEYKVLRGGAWGYAPNFLRSAYRLNYDPAKNVGHVGFRCVVLDN